ncbi:O-antigen ligase domain-containing protein [Sphingomonas sp. ABOLG]|uniref:O-antigen ligase family protein n=1 Tax=Sphingomonas sp. ABOLG TaxID=1985880 RepID=UPI000F7D67BC|nr:O-antigen ligase family protein [Sphingomonas sp. ABOLG]RSV14193.1 O-antigen ligase domain-containing protein [Sphingomonas sp. ABOLG]
MVHAHSSQRSSFRPDLPLVLIIAMVALLWIAGGASRADAMGQVIVRAGCWAILIAAILGGSLPALARGRPVAILLAATMALPLIQLIPLPPAWWQALPGRDILLIPGETPPWRPWTMTPGATHNALASLIVPVTMFLLLTQANDRIDRWMPTILLGMIAAAMMLGLLQFSGAGFNSPLLNDTPGVVSSIFANRNHFALLLAIGCVIAPVWAFMDREALRWRGPLAGGLVLLFVLTILATGSRAGALLGVLALALALLLVGRRLRRRLKNAPRWVFPALVLAAIIVVAGFIALSFLADRAQSIDRLIAAESGGEDMRSRALPTVLSMIAAYMPFGSGFGGFDPVFRIHEPFDLLKLTYFNQAHNDYLGIALDGGLAGVAVLAAGILWWLVATIRIWRAQESDNIVLARLGSAMIFLVLVASITDYPARTPTIMAFLVVAGVWLAQVNIAKSQAALPD